MDKNIILKNFVPNRSYRIETEVFTVPSTSSNESAHTFEIVINNDIFVNPSPNPQTLSQKFFNQNLDIENNFHNLNREFISENQKIFSFEAKIYINMVSFFSEYIFNIFISNFF
ncbi:hypothetical protein CWI39_2219p0010 [Hamiltosporidium magnivora]|uniref:Uncharacterized protein n=1 Tax=Hamiltosporidium magnivora TaxID=148818 RepID=A0A4Q9KVM7_9MICR|nr:hypothetical protein CWI39_2219p0010 [Hamiltosporidium magnivora]